MIDALAERAARKAKTPVNDARRSILRACREKASLPPGRFSLTVPTGGGKTLSAMSFALRHAKQNHLDRVIVVIPYTSIIEQNAKVYRDALNDPTALEIDNVLEHHSNLDESAARDTNLQAEIRRQVAAENRASPVVVTTSVQFFESLLSNHPSRCRKLHNIAKTVIILDEVQTLPPALLSPILDLLRELTDHYGCSVVLSTATPPALRHRENQGYKGLRDVTEIAPDPSALARTLRRVEVTWPKPGEVTPLRELAVQLQTHDRVLAIVNLRKDARELVELVGHDAFHLSALMCPAHRLFTLNSIRKVLLTEASCRIISSPLIECGVDLSVPVVYRAMAGFDSLVQSAGRCDREGILTLASGSPARKFIVFRAPTSPPSGTLRKGMQTAEHLLALEPSLDIFEPNMSIRFFSDLYAKHDTDRRRIQFDRQNFDFATVAAKFRLIDDGWQAPIVVPYGDAMKRVDKCRDEPTRLNLRSLQAFTVQISKQHLNVLRSMGAVESLWDQVDVPTGLFGDRYDKRFGMRPTEDGVNDVDILIQ